jgi:hypothetical protein
VVEYTRASLAEAAPQFLAAVRAEGIAVYGRPVRQIRRRASRAS